MSVSVHPKPKHRSSPCSNPPPPPLQIRDSTTLQLRHPKSVFNTSRIQRANLDGSTVEDLVLLGTDRPIGLAVNPTLGKVYWVANRVVGGRNTGIIQRANFDGSNVEDLVTTGLIGPNGIALDVAGGKMYWTDANTDKIQRANLE